MDRRTFVSSIVAFPFLSFLFKKAEAEESEFFTGCLKKANGDKEWYQDGKLHRDGGPAVERANGIKEWHKNGKWHRIGGPAIECVNGKYWYQNGELHREDGPAVERDDGDKLWYKNGKLIKNECGEMIA